MAPGRVLLDAGAGESVKYLDGNKLNLRRENLALKKGKLGLRRDREYLRLTNDIIDNKDWN